MATDASSLPNGTHGNTSGYDSLQGSYAASQPYSQPYSSQVQAPSAVDEIPKEEVGWHFIQTFYVTLSKSPEKLHLFYNRRSQFVLGDETDKVSVCVGQKSISERIKELDFHDCKVRVTNVDCQASDANIVIQVIGEISQRSQPHKKFAQTFVLAAQTNGYFVLNDIFRYLVDEEEQEPQVAEAAAVAESGYQEPIPTTTSQVKETLTSSNDPVAVETSAKRVDAELEEKIAVKETEPAAVNGDKNPEVVANQEYETAAPDEPAAPSSTPLVQSEQSKEVPEPAASQAKQATQPPTPAATTPAKPAVPKTWANLAAAANRGAAPVGPAAQQQTPSATPSQPKSTSTPVAPVPSAPTTQIPDKVSAPIGESPPATEEQDEWTSVGGHGRQQARAQPSTTNGTAPQSRAYIKNVSESVTEDQLRSTLGKFGEIRYLDISRAKNCAFVDFATPEAYQAAVQSNPHQIGHDRILVEERRLKPGSYPYVQRGGLRGGRGGAGGPGRGTYQGQRGGFPNRGRGRGNQGA